MFADDLNVFREFVRSISLAKARAEMDGCKADVHKMTAKKRGHLSTSLPPRRDSRDQPALPGRIYFCGRPPPYRKDLEIPLAFKHVQPKSSKSTCFFGILVEKDNARKSVFFSFGQLGPEPGSRDQPKNGWHVTHPTVTDVTPRNKERSSFSYYILQNVSVIFLSP